MIYNGKDFSDFGVHVDESKSFGTPEKDYELIEIMGRNGSYSIYNNRFKDIELSFPCFIRTGFIEKYRNLLAYLSSQNGYQRLETEKEPDHFRKALFLGMVEPQTTAFNHGGFFTVNFHALPQRFLKSGENVSSISTQSTTLSGNPIQIDNPSGLTVLTNVQTSFSPKQDLNGYDHPWVGGAGKNKLDLSSLASTSSVTVTEVKNPSYTFASSGASNVYIRGASALKLAPSTAYILTGGLSNIAIRLREYDSNSTLLATHITSSNAPLSFTTNANMSYCDAYVVIYSLNTSTTIQPMIRLASETDAAYEPYENICPISGHTSATVQRSGKNLALWDNENNPNRAGFNYSSESAERIEFLKLANGGEFFAQFKAFFVEGQSYTFSFDKYSVNGTESTLNVYTYSDRLWGTAIKANWQVVKNGSTWVSTYTGWAFVGMFTTIKANSTAELTNFRIEIGSAKSPYEEAQIQSVTVDLNGTVYGGTLDVSTGVLTLTHYFVTINGQYTVNKHGIAGLDGYYIYLSSNGLPKCASTQDGTKGQFNMFKLGRLSGGNGCAFVGADTIQFRKDGGGTGADMKTWLASNPLQVCYPLATPQTVQLTAQQISLLTGVNYISTDADTLTVTITEPSVLENPTLFESKPIIRLYGSGTLNINDQYITVAEHPFPYIDIDCELMDAFYQSSNANRYVSFSTDDYVTLQSGSNYFAYDGFTKVEVTPRWWEV